MTCWSSPRKNAAKAGARNVEFLISQIEDLPLPAASVDVVISNCAINLSTDKPAVLAEMFHFQAAGSASPTSSPRTASPPPTGPRQADARDHRIVTPM